MSQYNHAAPKNQGRISAGRNAYLRGKIVQTLLLNAASSLKSKKILGKTITPILHYMLKTTTKWVSATKGKSGFGCYTRKIKVLKNLFELFRKHA